VEGVVEIEAVDIENCPHMANPSNSSIECAGLRGTNKILEGLVKLDPNPGKGAVPAPEAREVKRAWADARDNRGFSGAHPLDAWWSACPDHHAAIVSSSDNPIPSSAGDGIQ